MSPETTPPEITAIDHVQRWHDMVDRRRIQMETAYAAAGIVRNDYWGHRAKQYRAALHQHTDEDPFFLRVKSSVTRDSTVIDIGAGTGRHTLALAPHVRTITAVDPSEAMLGLLREDVEVERLTNVEIVHSEWLAADVPPADVVICSHVLYPIVDVVPFVRALEAHATQRVFLYMRVDPLPTDLGLWGEFYGGVALQGQPSAIDIVNLLYDIGIAADIEATDHVFTWTFADLDEAVVQLRNSLCINESDTKSIARLRELLGERLIAWPDGRLGPRVGSARSAIISWQPKR